MNAIDLFCGVGGSTQGLKTNGINVLAGIDIWDVAIDSYNSNHENGLCKDLTIYKPIDLEREIKRKDIDIITSSSPCQSYSLAKASKRTIDDSRNDLYLYFIDYVNHFKPKIFLMENVIGMLSMKTKNNILITDDIKTRLKDYNIEIFKLYANDYGVCQKRRRVVIIGYNKKLNKTPTIPEKVIADTGIKNILEEKVDDKLYLSEKAINGINNKRKKMKEKGYGFKANLIKDIKEPSYTITSRYYKDGSDCLIYYDENKIRRLSELELKRIQSFPDDYIIKGNKIDRYIQIGNAVPPTMMSNIIKSVLNEIKRNINN